MGFSVQSRSRHGSANATDCLIPGQCLIVPLSFAATRGHDDNRFVEFVINAIRASSAGDMTERTHVLTGSAAAEHPAWRLMLLVWAVSFVATLGSLFFSEVMRLPPCVLCWYQRVCMYPLVAVFAVGMLYRDFGVTRYGWPLVVSGLAIASYHNLLYYHLIPESITPCTTGVSCTSRQIEWLGFITIPLLSLVAFTMIAVGLWRFHHAVRGRER